MERKREIADRVIAQWKERGFALDADPHYMRLVELWIAGEIGGAEMRRRYAQFLADQADERGARAGAPNLQPSPIGLDPVGLCESDAGSHEINAGPQARSQPLLETD